MGMPTRTGPLPRQTGDGHEPTHALGNLVKARPLEIRAVLTKTGDATVHQTRIDAAERFVIHPQARFDIRAVILHRHVRLGDETLKDLQALRLL